MKYVAIVGLGKKDFQFAYVSNLEKIIEEFKKEEGAREEFLGWHVGWWKSYELLEEMVRKGFLISQDEDPEFTASIVNFVRVLQKEFPEEWERISKLVR